jgi:hypothetical protein
MVDLVQSLESISSGCAVKVTSISLRNLHLLGGRGPLSIAFLGCVLTALLVRQLVSDFLADLDRSLAERGGSCTILRTKPSL